MLCLSDYRGDGGRNVIPSTLWTMTEVLAVLVAEDRRADPRRRDAFRDIEIRRPRDGFPLSSLE